MNSEMNYREIRDRLATLIGTEKPYKWASRIGIPSATFSRFWKDGRLLRRSSFRDMADAAGISLDWLLTGAGPIRIGQPQEQISAERSPHGASTAPAAEPELLALVIDAIQRTYKDAGAGLSPRDLGRLSGEMHNEIIGEGIAPGDWRGAVQMAAGRLRKEIAATASDISNRKREAS